MFSAKQLSEDQKTDLHQFAAEGATIADLQKRLKDEHGISITYMDARFLVLDLGIELVIPPEPEQKLDEPSIADKPLPTGEVSATMDSIATPGAMVSGKVTFSDGESAIWMIDQTGRPSLDPDTSGYRPSEEDVLAFQKQLSELVRGAGL